MRESSAELFLQTPAVPPALGSAVDPATAAAAPPAAADAADVARARDEAAAEGADAAAEAAEGEAAEGGMGDAAPPTNDALTEAIAATINSQVAAHQEQLSAEFQHQEQLLLDRVAALETKLK